MTDHDQHEAPERVWLDLKDTTIDVAWPAYADRALIPNITESTTEPFIRADLHEAVERKLNTEQGERDIRYGKGAPCYDELHKQYREACKWLAEGVKERDAALAKVAELEATVDAQIKAFRSSITKQATFFTREKADLEIAELRAENERLKEEHELWDKASLTNTVKENEKLRGEQEEHNRAFMSVAFELIESPSANVWFCRGCSSNGPNAMAIEHAEHCFVAEAIATIQAAPNPTPQGADEPNAAQYICANCFQVLNDAARYKARNFCYTCKPEGSLPADARKENPTPS